MKPFIEQRLYTQTDQFAIIQPNETNNGLILITRDNEDMNIPEARLYLTFDEADALCKLIQQMKEHLKDGN